VAIGHGAGTGHLNVNDGGRLEVQGDLGISTNFAGGSSQTGVALVNGSGVVSVTGTVYVGNGSTDGAINGVLGGTGVVEGNIVVRGGGLYAPGNSPGLSSIVGDLLFDGGWLEIEIAGLTA